MALIPDPLHRFPFARDVVGGETTALRLAGLEDPLPQGGISGLSPWTSLEVEELERFNLAVGNEAGVSLAKLLSNTATRVVVTGQQPNLLASPLYILYKALSACAHAKSLSASLKCDVIPVFWVASDDHDFQELRDCWVADSNGRLTNLGAAVSRGSGVPAGSPAFHWRLAESRDRLLDQAQQVCNDPVWLPLIEEATAGAATFESAFCRILTALLGPDFPMLFVVPRLVSLRNRQVPLLIRDMKVHEAASTTLKQAGDELTRQGYSAVLERKITLLNFFYLQDSRRLRLEWQNQLIEAQDPVTHQVVKVFKPEEIESQLQEYPECFSPNVVTRPMVQDSTLPCISYIAGPGEIQYLAQLRQVYPLYDIAPASVLLRTSLTILDSSVQAWLLEHGTASANGKYSLEDLEASLAERPEIPSTMLREIKELETEVGLRIAAMASHAADVNSHVNVAVRKTEQAMLRSLDKLRERLARQPKQNANSFERILTMLAPKGQAQERILSPFNFMAGQPDARSRELYGRCDFSSMQSQIIAL